jgi:RHH-type proline utilization regulon transcriptional repressor/proline dehydrogenase/delta 1-pyrroline-5-carboxylate dehydrogenase
VLHLLRFHRDGLDALLDDIRATGYGLTFGLHTRIDETVVRVATQAHAGNLYVNRNMVGAVVGVQPFGGEGLSGTGPKAGGPLYLLRLLARSPEGAALRAIDAAGTDARAPIRGLRLDTGGPMDPALRALKQWADRGNDPMLASQIERLAANACAPRWRTLSGPTGEANLYAVLPRESVLCLADDEADRLRQLAAVLALGGCALWPASAAAHAQRLPDDVRERVALAQDWTAPSVRFDAALFHGTPEGLAATQRALAARPGPIVGLTACAGGDAAIPLERLVVERALSVNTAAAGGNASLMAIG